MSLEHSLTENGTVIFSLADRVDAKSAPAIQQEMDKIIADSQGSILLDCNRITYVSSAGLRVFISIAKLLKVRQRKLALCGLAGNVSDVFAVSGFNSIFDIFATREEALSRLA